MGALNGVRVIEFGGNRASQATGTFLAQLGAEVIQLEPWEGMKERSLGPFAGSHPDQRERSIGHWYYSSGKKSVTYDSSEIGELASLLATADVLLDGDALGVLRRLGADHSQPDAMWKQLFPHLIACRVTDYGETGPWAELASSDLVSLALGGVMAACGYDDQGIDDPIGPAGGQAGHVAAMHAAGAVVAALLHLDETGRGQYIDLSSHEAIAVSTEMGIAYWEYQGVNPRRATARHARPYASPPWNHRCRDGEYFCALPLYIDDRQFASLLEWMTSTGFESDLDRPEFLQWAERSQRMDHVVEVIGEFCALHDSDYLFHEAQARRLPWAPVQGPQQLLKDRQLASRGFFVEIDDEHRSVTYQVPGAPFKMSATPCAEPSRPPLLGEHNDLVEKRTPLGAQVEPRASAGGRVLEGVRVLDFSWSVVGPTITRNLAALGAEVFKVEWPTNPDAMRSTMYRAGEEAPSLDNGPFFAAMNVGKQSLSLNARSEAGLETIRDLVAKCDVIVESFSAGVLKSWGLDYPQLREINPRIVYVSASGFGHSGPYVEYRTWGPSAQAFNGLTNISGLPGLPRAGWGWSYMDVVAGGIGTIGALAAIRHVRETGVGQHVDMAQVESGLSFQGASLIGAQLLDSDITYLGNRSLSKDGRTECFRGDAGAPYGVYRTAGDGHDDYCVITVRTDEQWEALCEVLNDPELSEDVSLKSLEGRVAAQDRIDEKLSSWAQGFSKYEVMDLLQHRGVAAGAVQSPEDRMEHDPQLRARGLFIELDHPKIGGSRFQNLPWHMSVTPPALTPRWPILGQDNDRILSEELGYTSTQIQHLDETHVLWPKNLPRQVRGRALW